MSFSTFNSFYAVKIEINDLKLAKKEHSEILAQEHDSQSDVKFITCLKILNTQNQ